jgi:hypothetical protein|tara:strand:+ start:1948 stop:2133 length:186 start_codon:yes stop_codon:yes gene_type:complete
MKKNMRLIDEIINDLEDRVVEFASGGDDEKAEHSRLLASKYKQMKNNGHLTVYNKEKKNER